MTLPAGAFINKKATEPKSGGFIYSQLQLIFLRLHRGQYSAVALVREHIGGSLLFV